MTWLTRWKYTVAAGSWLVFNLTLALLHSQGGLW